MANQQRVQRESQTQPDGTVDEVTPSVSPERQAEIDALKAETDSMLDEIDEILEQNAEEFVSQYIQKSGE